MRNQFAFDILRDKVSLVKIFDSIVGVAPNADDDLRIENFDGLLQEVESDCSELCLWIALL